MHRPGRFLTPLLAIAVAMVLGVLTDARARVAPYYVLEGVGTTQGIPRVLFVVDTSASMIWQSQETVTQCTWETCEDGDGAAQSRIAAARDAIRTVVESTSDSAEFALMTFDQHGPPSSAPPTCDDGSRFNWSSHYGYFVWDEIRQYPGYTGAWRLCDDADRPYPYLRWDELGVGSVITADDQTGDVPASPLISTVQADMTDGTNATRRVQWFPQFMGVRANLSDTTDPDGSIVRATVGDWATTDTDRRANVWEQDFYYWPYVDGFPGYAGFVAWPVDEWPEFHGVAGADDGLSAASLYAPFYLDLSDSGIPTSNWGPADTEAATQQVISATSPIIEGGLDAAGNTPWASAIGAIPGTATEDNSAFSHSSVASYLQFVTEVSADESCEPTIAVLVTDGEPSEGEGGSTLYSRLAALRNDLGVRTYVVGFFIGSSEVNDMACAGAGACTGTCSTPCNDTPAANWDTCKDPDNPSSDCAYLANSVEDLAEVLGQIVATEVGTDLGSGPGARLNDFGVGADDDDAIVQTEVSAYTSWPGWQGHVVRELCTDEDPDNPGEPAPWCEDVAFDVDEAEETFGPCPQSRTWDAGECLQQTDWVDRRLFSHDADNDVYAINEDDGTATTTFITELTALGIVDDDPEAEADAIVEFLLGKDWPDDWKLPGLANSAPVVVRRVPAYDGSVTPSVMIRDPHCAGRTLSSTEGADLPPSLEEFAQAAWDEDELLTSPSEHYEYQEAVLIGDDLGVLHAFQLDSGNELWGLLPRALLASAAAQAALGAANVGQPPSIDDHIYGIAATLNQGWVYDDTAPDEDDDRWRHLGVLGFGAGGSELLALDLSHMSPESPDGPIEILWTSEDASLAAAYDAALGQTWARPAIAYEVGALVDEPVTRLVFGSGYGMSGVQGRVFAYADALTGEILEQAELDDPAGESYTPYGDFGTVADVAVGTHCISRFWAEAQEAYVADTAGRLYRWDVGEDEADSEGDWAGTGYPVVQFPACQGTGTSCTVTGTNADVFTFGPAVSANDRVDDPGGGQSGDAPQGIDQFLVALASGSLGDQDLDAQDENNDFHTSLYLLVDDHSTGDEHEGFDIPVGAPKTDVGAIGVDPHYLRLALTDIERTRTFTPYAGAPEYTETRTFARRARPLRAPRITVTGVVDGSTVDDDNGPTVIEGVEVYRVTYTIFEAAGPECDARWYDSSTGTWAVDEGAVYEITLRLTSLSGGGFDFSGGAGDSVADFGGTLGAPELVLETVSQVMVGDCADGNCGPRTPSPSSTPCEGSTTAQNASRARFAIPFNMKRLDAFTPVE